MTNDRRKKLIMAALAVAMALLLPLTLAVLGIMNMWRDARAPQLTSEHSAALREAAERAADTVLPTPTLGADALVVECPAERFEPELQRVVRLAKGLGGAASAWNDGESVRIVANIPGSAETMFRAAVEQGIYDLQAAGESKQTVMVEVLLRAVGPAPKSQVKKPRSGG